jgi:ABC-type dipeptide/oligopeptide/nickel transport system permease subunit
VGGLFTAPLAGTWIDRTALVGSLTILSAPVFWLGMIALYFLGYRWRLVPLGGAGSLRHLLLPALVLGLGSGVYYARLLHTNLQEVLGLDYIRSARARGVGPMRLLGVHALRNAALPLLTIVGLDFASLMNGVVLTESVFPLAGPRPARVRRRAGLDVPIIMGTVLVSAVLVVVDQPRRRPPVPARRPAHSARADGCARAPHRRSRHGRAARAVRDRGSDARARTTRRRRSRRSSPSRAAGAPFCSAPTTSGATCCRDCSTARASRSGRPRRDGRDDGDRDRDRPRGRLLRRCRRLALMRVTDVMLAFPGLLLAVALVAVLRPSVWTIFVVIGLVSWTGVARVVRSEVLSLRERDFVVAARAMGAGHGRILARHVLPNVVPTLIVIAALSTSGTILLDAGLSFLGIGVPPPTPTWGSMIQEASTYYRVAPWLMAFPDWPSSTPC